MRFLYLLMLTSLLAGCASAGSQAFQDTKAKAEAGDPAAERELGQMYSWGQGIGIDTAEGVKWLLKAEATGDPQARKDIADDYQKGFYAQGSAAEGHALRMRLAQDGIVPAERDVGIDFLRGQGTDVDYAQALLWSKKASDEGDALAPVSVAYMYVGGLGVPKDEAAAVDWEKLGAQRGYRPAQLLVASIYRLGLYDVPKDTAKADQYYLLASEGVMQNPSEMSETMKQIIDGHEVYPREAAAAKQGGLVTVEFDCPSRTPEHVTVTKSSGFPLLDAAARQAVLDSTFPKRELSLNGFTHFKINLNFDPTATNLPIGP